MQVSKRRLLSGSLLGVLFVFVSLSLGATAQTNGTNEWAWMGGSITSGSVGVYGTLGTPAQGNAPGGRSQPVSWTDNKGNLWLFGGDGFDSTGNLGCLNDLWEFDPSTYEWTWIGGSSTLPGTFGQEVGVYGTLGAPAAGNIPPGRSGAVSWTDAQGNLWLFGGTGYDSAGPGVFNDLWEFNPATNEWAWMGGADTPNQIGEYGTLGKAGAGNVPGARESAVSWTDNKGNLWLFGGTGYDSAGNSGNLNDLWKFSLTANEWTWMGGSDTANQLGVYGVLGKPATGNVPGSRLGPVGWTDGKGNFWLFGGAGLNDLWEFNPSTNEWTWMSGSSVAPTYAAPGQPGVYGTLQMPASGNVPGSRLQAVTWTDSKGNLWMFGGVGYDSADIQGFLNDLWEFNPPTSEWIWMGGSTTVPTDCWGLANWCGPYGVYGTLQTPALGDAPGGRYEGVSWTDKKGDFWMFGGVGFDAQDGNGYLSDLWEFQPNTGGQPVTAPPTISPGPGTYTSWQTVTISDTTPGATIHYCINGSTPALEYTAPITVSSSETIEAIASASGYANSNIATANYVANLSHAATPVFSVTPGNFTTAQTVAISDATPGATVYYAIGVAPTTASTEYTGPITVSSAETIEAIAVADGYLNSVIATAAYNIGSNPPAEWAWMGGSTSVPLSCPFPSCGEPGWYGTLRTPAAGNLPGGRSAGASWTDSNGHLWLFGGTGFDSVGNLGALNDLWEFDPSTNEWAWMGGGSTVPCMSAGNCSGPAGVYGTLGIPAASNVPGGRQYPAAWTDKNGHLWLFGGYSVDADSNFGFLNDLWEFDPDTNEWTWASGSSSVLSANSGPPDVYGTFGVAAAANTPGGRKQAVAWTDGNGNFWLYGGYGEDARGIGCYLNDLWEFSPSTNEWAWWFGSKSCPNIGQSGWPGFYGPLGVFAVGDIPWSLDSATSWTDSSGNLWLFGGRGVDTSAVAYPLNDMWEFDPSIDEWAWTSPNSFGATGGVTGVYGSIGEFGDLNIPGGRFDASAWTGSDGNFWLFGGSGVTNSFADGALNDLWEFKPSINEWAWMNGRTSVSQPGVYGTLGTPASGNSPGGREDAATWIDHNGNLWLFGGSGYDTYGRHGFLNDMWQYGINGPPSVPISPVATPALSPAAGTYNTPQTVTISDLTPGATIYYSTTGTPTLSNSTVYTGPITVGPTAASIDTDFEAIAVKSGYANSAVGSAFYNFDNPLALAPIFDLPPGTYTTVQTVPMNDETPGAIIYYTTDGTTPTTSSTVYNGPITVSQTETIEAVAGLTGYITSFVSTAVYTIDLPPEFTVSALPASFTVTAGQSGTTTITVTPQGGFNSAVSFACSGLPAGASCSFSPATVTPPGTTSTTLTVTTSASSAALRRSPSPLLPGSALAVVLCYFGLKKRRRLQMLLLLAVCAAGLTLFAGCGGGGAGWGGSGGGGTQPVTTTVTVTANSGTLTHTTTFTLTVN